MRERSEMILADLILTRAEKNPDLDVLTFEHFSLDGGKTSDDIRSFASLYQNANSIAAALTAHGIQKGDRFAIMMRNHPEFVESMIAASITSALFVPIDPRTRGEKLAFQLRNAECSILLCADYCLPNVAEIRNRVPTLKNIFALETGEAETGGTAPRPISDFHNVTPFGELLLSPPSRIGTLDIRTTAPTDPLQIMYTSGTTGDPKGIVGTNARFCGAGILGSIFGYQTSDRPYTGLSFTHGNAQSVTLAPALFLSLRAVVSRRFTKSKLWDVCRRYGCTTFSVLGGIATALYSMPPRSDDRDNPVRMVISGGMPAAIWQAFEERFGLHIFEFYGAMDGGGVAYKPIGKGPVGSFGKPMPGLDMKILDEHDNECPPGVIGEICTRPSSGAKPELEYYKDQEASAKKLRGGWNRSGDMGHRDENGWLFFDYRSGGGLRRNGEFIQASSIEKIFAEIPAIEDVFVYGVPAASQAPGEKDIVAAIVLTHASTITASEIFAICREKLEASAVLSYLQIVAEIPKTASEKPQERTLIAQFDPRAKNVFHG